MAFLLVLRFPGISRRSHAVRPRSSLTAILRFLTFPSEPPPTYTPFFFRLRRNTFWAFLVMFSVPWPVSTSRSLFCINLTKILDAIWRNSSFMFMAFAILQSSNTFYKPSASFSGLNFRIFTIWFPRFRDDSNTTETACFFNEFRYLRYKTLVVFLYPYGYKT